MFTHTHLPPPALFIYYCMQNNTNSPLLEDEDMSKPGLSASCCLWCCSAFLDHETSNEPDFYEVLSVPKNASADQLKKSYKKLSLQMHPDKLAQRGETMTDEHR